ncbi:MAG: hypothetical protein LBT59_01165 [Clostridiales bacterium]|jgi:hypothetical protein|nr:hypothetical protein [Clostridiales bacterium]
MAESSAFGAVACFKRGEIKNHKNAHFALVLRQDAFIKTLYASQKQEHIKSISSSFMNVREQALLASKKPRLWLEKVSLGNSGICTKNIKAKAFGFCSRKRIKPL